MFIPIILSMFNLVMKNQVFEREFIWKDKTQIEPWYFKDVAYRQFLFNQESELRPTQNGDELWFNNWTYIWNCLSAID